VTAQRFRWTSPDGTRLVGERLGSGPPVVLLHGGGQTRHSWGATAERIAAVGRQAVYVDLRGHGESDRAADGNYDIDAHVSDLGALTAQLGDHPVLVGASLGGITALTYVGEQPDGGHSVTTALVLVDVVPRMEDDGVDRIADFMLANPDGFDDVDAVAEAVAAYLPGRERPSEASGLTKNLREGSDGRMYWHWDPAVMENAPSGERREALTARAARAAAGVRVPTLLVRGELSDVVSPAGVADFRDLVPHAEYAEIPGAGHMVAGDANDSFTSAIVDFLGGGR
jgi:non-heme chloroperoxidase